MNDTDPAAPDTARISVGIEQGPNGAMLVHGLNVPGCVAAGDSGESALEAFTAELSDWLLFRESVGLPVPDREVELEVAVDEWIESDSDVASGESSVAFDADIPPLTDAEIADGLHLLGELRGRLLRELKPLGRGALDGERDDLADARQVLNELARAQWWILTRLGASPLAEVPEAVLGRLDTAMALVVQQFTGFARDARERVVELDGEVWTPRKVLRRLLWLEWWLGRAALALIPEGSTR